MDQDETKQSEVLLTGVPVAGVEQEAPQGAGMNAHTIKRDKYQWIISHPWGCKQRKGMDSSMRQTFITRKENLAWDLGQCGLSKEELASLLASA